MAMAVGAKNFSPQRYILSAISMGAEPFHAGGFVGGVRFEMGGHFIAALYVLILSSIVRSSVTDSDASINLEYAEKALSISSSYVMILMEYTLRESSSFFLVSGFAHPRGNLPTVQIDSIGY